MFSSLTYSCNKEYVFAKETGAISVNSIHQRESFLLSEKINEHFMILDIISSAGTYIKEFVHSDLMRTEPSIKSLLDCDVDILQLDVRDLILLEDINK